MSGWTEKTNQDLSPEEILGADVNQSLHHLVGYVWAEGNQQRDFPTEKFCNLIQFVFDQHKQVVAQRDQLAELAREVIEEYAYAICGGCEDRLLETCFDGGKLAREKQEILNEILGEKTTLNN